MAELWDIYVLARARSPELIHEFVSGFVPRSTFGRSAQAFALRANDREVYVGDDFARFVALGCEHSTASGGARIHRSDDASAGGWVYFNADGSLVLGLTEHERRARKRLEHLVASFGDGYGYIAGDAPPHETREAFVEACRQGAKDFVVRPTRR